MTLELKEIKKKYGEEMAHFCREHFSTLLEIKGLLSSLLMEHFDPSHELYNDLKENNLLEEFVKYLYSFREEKEELIDRNKTPEELLAKAGYDLYECKTENAIQSFKKYYAKGEELCTFRGGRLKTDYVFFAVKKNVDTIKREDFKNPKRQDEYGTSVISIQFDRETNQVSIKNRYNHTVTNPDSTFSNNLDNIIEGLTKAFERVYGFKQKYLSTFEIPDYVMVNGKYYKYNYEINHNYYCTNNIFIKRDEVNTYEKERYILFDFYLLDIKDKTISYLDENIIHDHFIKTIKHIQKVEIEKEKNNKKIIIENDVGNHIEIIINQNNQMVSYKNIGIQEIKNDFCFGNDFLTELYLPEVTIIGNRFCRYNQTLTTFYAPNLESIGDRFCFANKMLKNLLLPKLKYIGNYFCYDNTNMKQLDLPEVKNIGDDFCYSNHSLTTFYAPNLECVGHNFCRNNEMLKVLSLPKLECIGHWFFKYNTIMKQIDLPNVIAIGDDFCLNNTELTELNLPKLENAEIISELLNKKCL